jgi:hypothetical protein
VSFTRSRNHLQPDNGAKHPPIRHQKSLNDQWQACVQGLPKAQLSAQCKKTVTGLPGYLM